MNYDAERENYDAEREAYEIAQYEHEVRQADPMTAVCAQNPWGVGCSQVCEEDDFPF